LREALRYVAAFVSDGAVHEDLSLLQLTDGTLLGGTPECIAAYSAESLQGLSLKIRNRFLEPLTAALANLSHESVLFETSHYYVLYGAPLTFGFEKTQRTFPPIGSKFSPNATAARFLLTRDRLVTILKGLIRAMPDDNLVEVKESKDGKRLRLTAATGAKRITAWCPGSRQDLADSRLLGFIPLTAIMRAAQSFETPNIVIDFYPGTVLIVRDGTDTSRAEAIMSFVSQRKPKKG
jgi:hypothetical protein